MYRRAISLGLRELESNPDAGMLLAQLGYYYGRTGKLERSLEYLERAAATPRDGNLVYYLSVAAADRGDIGESRRTAAEAVKLGYPESLLRADPSLASLRGGRPAG
jgi:tetratricopeptide (TPR) repeat protein